MSPVKDSSPALAWGAHTEAAARVTDLDTRRSLLESLERDRELHAASAFHGAELRAFRLEVAERDGRVLAALGRLEGLVGAANVRLARVDNEREVTRQEVKDVHRWAEQFRKDADESAQRLSVSLVEATKTIAREELQNAKASVALDVTRGALASLTGEGAVERRERRGRPWALFLVIFVALASAGASFGFGRITAHNAAPPPAAAQGAK